MGKWNCCLSSVLLGHQNLGSSSLKVFQKEPYQTWSAAVKTLKNQNAPTRTHEKSQLL